MEIDTDRDPIKAPRWIADDLGVSLTTLWRMQKAGVYPKFERRGLRLEGLPLSVHRKAKAAITAGLAPADDAGTKKAAAA